MKNTPSGILAGDVNGALERANVPKDRYIGNVIGAFARALSDKVDKAVTDTISMSSSACYTIVQIGSEPNSTIDELRRMLSLEHSSLVRMLDRLEKMDLIMRQRGRNGDKRSVSIVLTEEGELCFSRINQARSEVLEKLTDGLSDQEEDSILALVEKLTPKVVDIGDDQHFVCRLCNLEVCPQSICPVNLAHPGHEDEPSQLFRRAPEHSCLGSVTN